MGTSERRIIFLVAAVQFVNFVDFMMVMPLGPDFAVGLGIPSSQLGVIASSYTFSAFLAGLAGTLFLDRFDRRSALFVCLLGLVCGTAAGGFAVGLKSLIAARMLAGAFGGPAAALAFAIVSDVVPPERRGKAMGAVMGAFSAAAVLGVPMGLEAARWGGWKAPFFCLAVVQLVVGIGSVMLLPPLRSHISEAIGSPLKEIWNIFKRRNVQLAMTTQFFTMAAGFLIVPNISAYVQYNALFPRDSLGLLYLGGGIISFFAMRLTGSLIDRRGVLIAIWIITLVHSLNIVEGFMFGAPYLPVLAMFFLFMTCQAMRNVAVQTITTKVPLPQERARYQSLQTAIQHLATSTGAYVSTLFLVEVAGPRIEGMSVVATLAIVGGLIVPMGLGLLEKRLKGHEF